MTDQNTKKIINFLIGTAIAFVVIFIVPDLVGIGILLIYLIGLPIAFILFLTLGKPSLKSPNFLTWTFIMLGIFFFYLLVTSFLFY